MKAMEAVWYKYKYFWRRGDNDGDESNQDRGDGTGDLIFNTLTKIVKDQDRSEWAIESYDTCAQLLLDGKRYPDEFLTGLETRSMVEYWIDRAAGINSLKPQGRMSRDPFIALGRCCVHLLEYCKPYSNKRRIDTLLSVRIPLHLQYALGTMVWWWRLRRELKRKRKQQHYVRRLRFLKDDTGRDLYLKLYEDRFYDSY